jgi:hypothetical protein
LRAMLLSFIGESGNPIWRAGERKAYSSAWFCRHYITFT